jgi:hypothetical protein
MTTEQTINLVSKRFNLARNNQVSWFEKFIRWYGLYRGYQARKNYYGRSNLFIPASFWTVESYVPRVVRALRKIIATPQAEDDVANAKATSALLEFQQEQLGWVEFLDQWVRSAGIYGSYPAKVSWKYTGEKKEDRPQVDLVDINDLFIDPNAEDIDQARWVIHKTTKHFDDLKTTGTYKNLDQIMPRNSGRYDGDQWKQQRKAILSVAQQPPDSQSKIVDLYEYWGFDDDGNNMLLTVANKNTVIREEPNPMADILPGNALPFVMLYDLKVPHELYGIGEIEPIEKLQEELNDTRNQRMDNVTLILNRMWEVLRTADVSEENFVSMPGKVFYSNIPNGIREISTPDVTNSAYNEEKLIKEDIQQTAVGSANVDIPAVQKSETATGILAIQEAGDTRTEEKVKNLKIAVKKLWRMILALDQTLLDKDFVIRIKGQTGITFEKHTPSDIKGNFDIDVEVESQQNRMVKKQEAMQLYQLSKDTPNANIEKAYKDLLELFDKSNPDEYVLPPPPPPPPQTTVNISLRGDLNPLEVDDFAKQAGASDSATDPMARPEMARALFPNSNEQFTHGEIASPDINTEPPPTVGADKGAS